MTRILSVAVLVSVLALTVYGILTLYDETLQVGRMWETPAIKPHEEPLPVMASGTVPFNGGEAFYRAADPNVLMSPLNFKDPAVVRQGSQAYQYYCIQCHGKYHDGQGTVGQSFSPLPGDLRNRRVQTMAVGQLFKEISYGIPGGRQPALATTVTVNERWQVIGYIKSLGLR
ncbi:MAG: c-type cytochrome [Desulfosarcinaceae bacterium]